METRSDSLDFSAPLSGSGPRAATTTLLFPRSVTAAAAGISGLLAEYGSHDDHHVGRLEIRLDTTVNANTVTVDGHLGVRDWSGNWDDQYDGVIDFVVLAELESATAPPPRPDLAIVGAEFNQATQFFQASSYLDPGNWRPDNSVFLIEGKDTGVRVFVDWDRSAGLPPIAQLTGDLVVITGSSTVTLSPINPGGSIVPRAAATINQAVANHTLNFRIPGGLSAGTVGISCRVFDASSTAARSAAFERTLVFVPVEPLNMFLVGIQTLAPAAAAPSQAAVAGSLAFLKKTYPRGLVQATGFTTATLASQIAGLMPSGGCGQGWSDLLDILRDLKGDSDDVYFGGLPAGISAAGVVGCSPVGERIAASFIDIPFAVAHEVGHGLGRRHDPCRTCSRPAQDPDPSYPQYDNFNSDSIGVFGFDPSANTVFDPANTLDFMTAFLPPSAWISPYTYGALVGSAAPGSSTSGGLTWAGGLHRTLFLRLTIDRDGKVHRDCSFTYPAPPQTSGCKTDFGYELLDSDEQVVDCGVLHCPCVESSCECWPKRIRDAIPLPDDATFLVVRHGKKEVYREEFGDPSDVRLAPAEPTDDGVRLRWRAEAEEDCCFLVQVRDQVSDNFRGIAARSADKSIDIPKTLFTHKGILKVRVLMACGITTSAVETEVELPDWRPKEIVLDLLDISRTEDGPDLLPPVVSVLAVDSAGREVKPSAIVWYDEKGGRVSQGSSLDLRTLPKGSGLIRAVVKSHGGRTAAMSWLVERTDAGFYLHAKVVDPRRLVSQEPHSHPHPPREVEPE